jgi:tRNA(His) guanylyltransferase
MKLDDRMKVYESRYSAERMMPLIPLCARMDGKAFHTFTAGLDRPFDQGFSDLMIETTTYLVGETGARCGYTQSDEISLVWVEDDPETMFPFDGKLLKLTSILAAMTTLAFNRSLPMSLPAKAGKEALFDARIWSVPNMAEAVNYLTWREQDATRNSINMAAQSVFSHRQLQGKNTKECQERLWHAGVNWNDYPRAFKRGTYVQRRSVDRPFTTTELERLPPKHEARLNPDLIVTRQEMIVLDLPPLSRIANLAAVLFAGAEPILRLTAPPLNTPDSSAELPD